MTRVMVFGTFDLLHLGHRSLLSQAAALGEVTVIVARSDNVKRIKGRLPRDPEEQRMKAVKEALPDAEVVLGDSKDFLAPIRERKPDLLLFGYDQRLPPGVTETDIPCPVRRAEPFQPETYKSSLMAERSREAIDEKGAK